jgi:translation initiation factor 1
MQKKQKIDVNAASRSVSLNNPFAALESDGLPEGKDVQLSLAPAPTAKTPARGRVLLRREKAHRGGKTVIVVYDFASSLPAPFIEELGRKIRNACGCGGTVKDRTIEVQGDQPARIRSLLEAEGFRVGGITS